MISTKLAIWPDKQTVIICKRLRSDKRSVLGEKLKKVLKRYGLYWRGTSTHEGLLTKEEFLLMCVELNEKVRAHNGPGEVDQLIAKVGDREIWQDVLEPPIFSLPIAA